MTLPAGISRHVDVRPHPHIGLSTVTYLFSGEIMHRDSVGSEQPIRPGEVNWMVAGRGITHSERFEKARERGDIVHGMQSWVALPQAFEEGEPSFAHHEGSDLPQREYDGVSLRLIAGRAFDLEARAKIFSPMFYAHLEMQEGASMAMPDEYSERAAYIVSGSVDADGNRYEAGQLLVFKTGASAVVTAAAPTTLMALGGEPIGTRFIEWNFVSSSKERIETAKADWRAGRFKLPDRDNSEFIPLPPDPPGRRI